jgi:hypothetical protein
VAVSSEDAAGVAVSLAAGATTAADGSAGAQAVNKNKMETVKMKRLANIFKVLLDRLEVSQP